MIDDEGNFFRVEHVIDGNLDGADFGQSHHADRIIMGVIGVNGDPVSLPDTVAGHQIGKAPRLPFQIVE
jgi:hypothetical protein